jgi:uncharacterized protein YkwD
MSTKLTQILVSACLCVLSVWVFVYFLSRELNVQTNTLTEKYIPEQVLNAVNNERIKMKLPRLIPNIKLEASAMSKVKDMKNYSYFSHVNPYTEKKWSDFIKESQYDYVVAGENLANGFSATDTVVEAWMNSPSHKENILNPNVTETGVAVGYGKLNNINTIFVVQDFGKLE